MAQKHSLAPTEDGTAQWYMEEVADFQPLSRQEEAALARRIRRGDLRARDRLIQANLRFVITVARAYQDKGAPLEDLIGAGNLGLVTAAERFDETRGVKFISYAVWWIRQAILTALRVRPEIGFRFKS